MSTTTSEREVRRHRRLIANQQKECSTAIDNFGAISRMHMWHMKQLTVSEDFTKKCIRLRDSRPAVGISVHLADLPDFMLRAHDAAVEANTDMQAEVKKLRLLKIRARREMIKHKGLLRRLVEGGPPDLVTPSHYNEFGNRARRILPACTTCGTQAWSWADQMRNVEAGGSSAINRGADHSELELDGCMQPIK